MKKIRLFLKQITSKIASFFMSEMPDQSLKVKIWLSITICWAILAVFGGYYVIINTQVQQDYYPHLIGSFAIACIVSIYYLYRFYDYPTQNIRIWHETGQNVKEAYMEALKFPIRYSFYVTICYYSVVVFVMIFMAFFTKIEKWDVFNIFIGGFVVATPGVLIAYFLSHEFYKPIIRKLFNLSDIRSLKEYHHMGKTSIRIKILLTYLLISTNAIVALGGFTIYKLYHLGLVGLSLADTAFKLCSIIFFNLLFTFFFAYILSRYVSLSLIQLNKNMGSIARAEGNLSQKVPIITLDEIGSAGGWFNIFLDDIRNIIAEIHNLSQDINQMTNSLNTRLNQIGSNMQDVTALLNFVANGTFKQMNNVTQVFSLAEEINSDTMDAIAASEGLESIINDTRTTTEECNNQAEGALANILDLSNLTEQTISAMKRLSGNLDEVADIAESIKSISLQTNLLALNAAIESARVGEEGEGFRSIALEIRQLNDDTNVAVIKISDLISDIKNSNDDAIGQLSEVSENVREGKEATYAFNRVLSEISTALTLSEEAVMEIIDRSQNQLSGLEEIISFIEGTSVISESNAASTQEVSANSQDQIRSVDELAETSHTLADHAFSLQKLMEKFKI